MELQGRGKAPALKRGEEKMKTIKTCADRLPISPRLDTVDKRWYN
jgi:hypothetical protein